MCPPPPSARPHFGEEENALLSGEAGPTVARAMELLAALAKVYGAEGFVSVQSAQISGVSYHNLGDAGLQFLEEWAEDGRVRIPNATLNPTGMDLERWAEMGIDGAFAEKQLRVVRAYEAMGVGATCTCTPYLAGNLPVRDQHVGWSESSAVTFANSVLGARTNREGGPAALAAALTGRTPRWGLHLEQNRKPDLGVVVEPDLEEPFHWGLLGAYLGTEAPGSLVHVTLERGASPTPSMACLKALSAALPTFGAEPMFHLAEVTPEAERFVRPQRSIRVTAGHLQAVADRLNDPVDRVDLVCLGCPHATVEELYAVERALGGRRVGVPLWLCTSRPVRDQAMRAGLVEDLERTGALVLCDTCFVVAPLRGRFKSVATDSAKGCYYSRGHNRLGVRTGTVGRCVEAAVSGFWR